MVDTDLPQERIDALRQEARAAVDAYKPGKRSRNNASNVSELENELAMQLEYAGIKYHRQYKAIPSRRFRFDFYFPGHKLLCEVQGGIYSNGAHVRPKGVLRDYEKINLAQYHGMRCIQVSGDDVRTGEALTMIEMFLEAQP